MARKKLCPYHKHKLRKILTKKKKNKKIIKDYYSAINELMKKKKDLYPNKKIPNIPDEIFPVKIIVNLGCLASQTSIADIIPVNIKWPSFQNNQNYSTGSQGPIYGNVNENIMGPIGEPTTNSGQPSFLGNASSDTSFQSTVYLTSNTDMYNISAVANGYGSITLGQEGILWTLWPLVKKPTKTTQAYFKNTYFNNITFGTSKSSRYALGQLGFFYNDRNLDCTPLGVSLSLNFDKYISGQPGLLKTSPPIGTGIQGLENTLFQMASGVQQVAIVVVKVSEELARIFNPIAGVSSINRFIYVGYDGWAVLFLSTNPKGPMMATTYLTPQSVTGSITKNNHQVILPPNFTNTIYYKNINYSVPIGSNNFIGA